MEKEKIRLGTVAFTPKGEWVDVVGYKRLNVVSFHGSSFYAKKDNVGQQPSLASDYWGLLVEGGDIVNNPDEEDITSCILNGAHKLRLADRYYNKEQYNDKGYKILRRNLKEVNLAVVKIEITDIPAQDGEVSITINNKDTHTQLSAQEHNTTTLVALAIKKDLAINHRDYDVEIQGAVITMTHKYNGATTASAYDVKDTGVTLILLDSVKQTNVNVLTSDMVNQENTIYEIRYAFNLYGQNLTIPKGCVLLFNTGTMKNGTITMQDTIVFSYYDAIFSDIDIVGKYVFSNFSDIDSKLKAIIGLVHNIKALTNEEIEEITNGTYIPSDEPSIDDPTLLPSSDVKEQLQKMNDRLEEVDVRSSSTDIKFENFKESYLTTEQVKESTFD